MTNTEPIQINQLLKKHKKLMISYQQPVKFKEPVLFLIRKTGQVDFYENVYKSAFTFHHSNGDKRTVDLNTRKLLTFPYGKIQFRGYIFYEEDWSPLPNTPEIEGSVLNSKIDKALADTHDWKAKLVQAEALKVKAWMWGLAILAGIAVLYYIAKPEGAPPPTEHVTQVIQNTLGG